MSSQKPTKRQKLNPLTIHDVDKLIGSYVENPYVAYKFFGVGSNEIKEEVEKLNEFTGETLIQHDCVHLFKYCYEKGFPNFFEDALQKIIDHNAMGIADFYLLHGTRFGHDFKRYRYAQMTIDMGRIWLNHKLIYPKNLMHIVLQSNIQLIPLLKENDIKCGESMMCEVICEAVTKNDLKLVKALYEYHPQIKENDVYGNNCTLPQQDDCQITRALKYHDILKWLLKHGRYFPFNLIWVLCNPNDDYRYPIEKKGMDIILEHIRDNSIQVQDHFYFSKFEKKYLCRKCGNITLLSQQNACRCKGIVCDRCNKQGIIKEQYCKQCYPVLKFP